METCKWIKYLGENLYHLPCGKTQGAGVRPNEKTCLCVSESMKQGKHIKKRIERIDLNELSPREKDFRKMLEQFR